MGAPETALAACLSLTTMVVLSPSVKGAKECLSKRPVKVSPALTLDLLKIDEIQNEKSSTLDITVRLPALRIYRLHWTGTGYRAHTTYSQSVHRHRDHIVKDVTARAFVFSADSALTHIMCALY
eukprot:6179982-Pleurochrysis_carterae.AAC.10